MADTKFVEMKGPWLEDFAQEDAAAVFSDVDNDGDQDLYVVSLGNQFQDHTDRLYVNLATRFVKLQTALPSASTVGKAIAVGDFDQDGLKDIFIGGRNTPGKYPFPASSLLLRNIGGQDETLQFEGATSDHAPGLQELGMVTDAVRADVDGDHWDDLILSGEWMPLTIFRNDQGRLVNQTAASGLGDSDGWWYTVTSLDVDQDGDLDQVLVGSSRGFHAVPASASGLLFRGDIKVVTPIRVVDHKTAYLLGTNEGKLRLIQKENLNE